jgi:AAA+ superfamily predicted ATPase
MEGFLVKCLNMVFLFATCLINSYQLSASEPHTIINAAGVRVAVAPSDVTSRGAKIKADQKHSEEELVLRASQMDPDNVLCAAMIEEAAKELSEKKRIVEVDASIDHLSAMSPMDSPMLQMHHQEQRFKMISQLAFGTATVAPRERFTLADGEQEFRPDVGEDKESDEYIDINHPSLQNRVKPEVYKPYTKKSLIKQIAKQLPREMKLIIDDFDKHGDNVDWAKMSKSFLLSGPAGSGKTSSAAVFAQRCGLDCVVVDCNSVCDEFENSGDIITRVIMNEVTKNNQPIVIVFDEFQEAVKKHSSTKEGTSMVSQIWRQMDKLKNKPVIIICIANEVEKLPSQILTRLKRVIKIELPTLDQRKEAFQFHLDTEAETFCSHISVDELAQKADGLSLREIDTVFKNARAEARDGKEVYTITMQHLLAAIDSSKKADSKVVKVEKSIWEVWYDKYRKPIMLTGAVLGIITATFGIYMYIKAPSQQAAQLEGQKAINTTNIDAQKVENSARRDLDYKIHQERLAHEKQMHTDNLAQQQKAVDRQNDPLQIAQNVAVSTTSQILVNKTLEYILSKTVIGVITGGGGCWR